MTLEEIFIFLINEFNLKWNKKSINYLYNLQIEINEDFQNDKLKKLLEKGGISFENVISYLKKKYKYEIKNNEIKFLIGRCLDKRINNIIYFKNSEIHKLITDLYYLQSIKPFKDEKIIINIEKLRMSPLEIPFYREILKKYNYKINEKWDEIFNFLIKKYSINDLKNLRFYSQMKKIFLRKKILRYYLFTNQISDKEFKIIKKI